MVDLRTPDYRDNWDRERRKQFDFEVKATKAGGEEAFTSLHQGEGSMLIELKAALSRPEITYIQIRRI